jgi:hypothetical protein
LYQRGAAAFSTEVKQYGDDNQNTPLIGQKVTLKRTEEDSIYDGPPINTPRTPYHVDYTPRFADKEKKFFPRVGEKLRFIGEDFVQWQKDLWVGDSNVFAYKTAYFVKRNFKHYTHSIGHTLYHIWDELKKVGLGFKMLKEDFKFFIRF